MVPDDNQDLYLSVWVVTESEVAARCVSVQCDSTTTVLEFIRKLAKALEVRYLQCVLYKPNQFLPHDDRTQVLKRLQSNKNYLLDQCQNLSSSSFDRTVVWSLWPRNSTPTARSSLVVRVVPWNINNRAPDCPGGGRRQEVEIRSLWKAFNELLSLQREVSVPPTRAKPNEYRKHQDGPAPLFDGRFGANKAQVQAAPVEVLHPAFALFVAAAQNKSLDIPSDLIVSTLGFMQYLSEIAPQARNQATTRAKICELIGVSDGPAAHERDGAANRIVSFAINSPRRAQAALAIIEEKGEFGESGEATVQGSFSYIAWWSDLERQDLLNACSCPSFIISIAGPWVAICAAIFTTKPVIQRLTDYIWLGDSRVLDDRRVKSLSRTFLALRLALEKLRAYYTDSSINQASTRHKANRFYPLATSFPLDTQLLRFRYLSHLGNASPACVTFLAESEGWSGDGGLPKLLVVKFVERYCPDAHELLANLGYAPKLLYYGPVWPENEVAGSGTLPHKMVVMDYIEGNTAFAAYSGQGRVPDDVRLAVLTAVRHLHKNGLVHGDIRTPNIVIESGAGDVGQRTKIIDFDWAGETGKARYPLNISKLGWPAGVRDLGLILPEHDLIMAGRI